MKVIDQKSALRLVLALWAVPVLAQDDLGPVSYLPLAPQSQPFAGLGAAKGLFQPDRTMVLARDSSLQTVPVVNWQTREVQVQQNYLSPRTQAYQPLWSYTYGEIADYAFDLNEFTLRNLWLSSLVGKEGAGFRDKESSTEFKLPGILGDLGASRPKLDLSGDLTVGFKGSRTLLSNDSYSNSRFILATPTPTIQSNFKISGKIGKHLSLEMNSTEEFGRDDLRLIYKEAEKGEFEDQILQEIEAGRTSLELPGTELTGYSSTHKGLFGIRTKMKFGDVMLTAIASQESGSQESYTLNSQAKETDFSIRDKDFIPYKYYFLSAEDKEYYIKQLLSGNKNPVNKHSQIHLYTLAGTNEPIAKENVTIVYPDQVVGQAPLRGQRVKELKSYTQNPKDYDYDYRGGVIYLPKGTKTALYAWSEQSVSSGGTITLFKDDKEVLPELNSLMLRNHYAVGISEDTKNQFSLRMVDEKNTPFQKLALLGIADKNQVPKRQDPTIFNTARGEMILPCQTLNLIGSRQATTPSGDTIAIPSGFSAEEYQKLTCLEPLRLLDTETDPISDLYTANVRDLNRIGNQLNFVGKAKKRSSTLKVSENQSISSGGCFDISPGTEKLMIGSTQLQKGVDYDVMYEYGQIELLSDRAKDPNNEISVTYECEPLFSIDNKLLLGLRAEYPFWKLGEGSHLGSTVLYKSQSTSEAQPRLGHEPFQSLLLGANLKLTQRNSTMTKWVNALPLVQTKAPSSWRFEAEVARSFHNPNTKGSALLDDFEGAKKELPFILRRQAWTQASPPGGVPTDGALMYRSALDYRHMGQLVWNSNFTRRFAEIYGSSGDDRIDVAEVPVLQMDFESNDLSRTGKSWGGLMHSNSDYSSDLSQYKYLELVLQGDVGELNLDFGAISEDLSIAGEAPNGTLQSEGDVRTGKATNDYGLDGIPDGSGESSLKWTCRNEEQCNSQKWDEAQSKDAALDNFKLEDRVTHPSRALNGTEGNNADRGGGWDSEDLNRNGSLDVQNDFVRYKIDLSKETGFDRLKGGWKRYRIPLTQFDSIWSSNRYQLADVLQKNATTRLWMGNLPAGVSTAQLQIARFSVVGSPWEESEHSSEFDSVGSIDQQVNEKSGLVDLSQKGAQDGSSLQVRVINNRDDLKSYYASPNTLVEKEKDSDTPLREQALVLQYSQMHPAQELSATRMFEGENKDLTLYSDMQLEIHLDGLGSGVRENSRFAIQLGQGDLKGSKNYYEWSFRPRAARCEELKLNLQATVSDAELRSKLLECHNLDWKANVFRIPLKDLWPLLKYQARAGEQDSLWKLKPENDSGYTQSFASQKDLFAELKRRKAEMKTLEDELMTASSERRAEILEKLSRLEAIGVVGQPSLSKINWIRFVVRADDDASDKAQGTLWINDLKLSGVRSGWGNAARSAAQLEFSDLLTLSGDVAYRDGDFATLNSQGSSPLPSLSESKSSILARADMKFSADKFLKDAWKTKIPITLSHSTQLERPYMQPNSDLILSQDGLGDLLPELSRPTGWRTDSVQEAKDRYDLSRKYPLSRGYQSLVDNTSFGLGYKRESSDQGSWLLSTARSFLLERPAMNFRYENRQSRSSVAIDTSRSYTTLVQYDLASKARPLWAGLRLWPEQMDLTLMDFNYVRTWHKDRALDLSEDTLSPVRDWQVNLSHKANIQWSLLSFATVNYTMDLSRLLDEDWQAWGQGSWLGTERGGFLGRNVFFDWDRSDYRYRLQKADTSAGIFADRIAQASEAGLGQSYGFLYQERKRTQNFRLALNPKIPYVNFIDQRINYTADFNQLKSHPEDFNPMVIADMRQNYWTVDRTASFEYRPNFQLQNFAKLFGADNALVQGLKKLQWTTWSFAWTAAVSTKGENFTLPFLHDSAKVNPANYYLWAFGLGDGDGLRNAWDIIGGDQRLKGPRDYVRWGQYFSPYYHNLDSLVDQHQFSNSIDRTASTDTRLTLPFAWDLSLNGSLAWKLQIQQNRLYALQVDTTISWPKWSVGARLPNVVPRMPVLKNWVNSLSFNSRLNFEKQSQWHSFQSSENSDNRKWSWEPLIGFQTETKMKITLSNDVNFSLERGWKYLNKYSLEEVAGAYELWDIYTDRVTYWTWKDKDFQRGYKFSDKATVSYALPTNKGFRVARWYLRLKNPVNLSANFNFEKKRTILENYRENQSAGRDSTRFVLIKNNPRDIAHPYIVTLDTTGNPVVEDMNSFGVRTTADYRFSEKITSDASIEYRRDADGVSGGDKGDIISNTLSYVFRVKVTF